MSLPKYCQKTFSENISENKRKSKKLRKAEEMLNFLGIFTEIY
jgi:hypothetical protein